MSFNAKFVGVVSTVLCSLTLMAANSRADETPAPSVPTPAPTYQEVSSILADNCGYCHTGGVVDGLAGISVDTEEEVVALAPKLFAAVDSGLMPYGDSEWRLTPDGITLLAYLKSQIPVQPEPEPTPEPSPTITQ